MNEDQVEGAATNLGGKIKDAVGSLTGDTKLQAGGKADKVGGQLQKTYGNAVESTSDGMSSVMSQVEDFVHDQPVVAMLSALTIGFLFARLINR